MRVRELAGCAKSPTVRPAPLGRSRHPRRVYPPRPAPFWPLPALVLVGPSSVSSVGPFVLSAVTYSAGTRDSFLLVFGFGFGGLSFTSGAVICVRVTSDTNYRGVSVVSGAYVYLNQSTTQPSIAMLYVYMS